MNPPWEETMDEEDVELASIQSIIRKSLNYGILGKTSGTVPDPEVKKGIRGPV